MTTLRSVGVVSSARLLAAAMAALGILAGIAYSFGGAAFDLFVSAGWITSPSSGAWSTPGLGRGTALAFLALIGMPLIFAACGLVAGAIGATLYNIVAGMVGGIEVRVTGERRGSDLPPEPSDGDVNGR